MSNQPSAAITVASDPNEKIDTEYGWLTIASWLEREQQRILRRHDPKNGKHTEIVKTESGRVQLWPSRISRQKN